MRKQDREESKHRHQRPSTKAAVSVRPRGVALNASDLAAQLQALDLELERAQGAPLSGAAAALLSAHTDRVFPNASGSQGPPPRSQLRMQHAGEEGKEGQGHASPLMDRPTVQSPSPLTSMNLASPSPLTVTGRPMHVDPNVTRSGPRSSPPGSAGTGVSPDGMAHTDSPPQPYGGRAATGSSGGGVTGTGTGAGAGAGRAGGGGGQDGSQGHGDAPVDDRANRSHRPLQPGECRVRFARHFAAHFSPQQLRRALQQSNLPPNTRTPRRVLEAAGSDLAGSSEVSGTCFDPRHPPRHAVASHHHGRWLTTGMFPQQLSLQLAAPSIVRAVAARVRAATALTVLVRVAGSSQNVPVAHASLRVPARQDVLGGHPTSPQLAPVDAFVVLPAAVSAEAVIIRLDGAETDFACLENLSVYGQLPEGQASGGATTAGGAIIRPVSSALDLLALARAMDVGRADTYLVELAARSPAGRTTLGGEAGEATAALRRTNSKRRLTRRRSRLRIN